MKRVIDSKIIILFTLAFLFKTLSGISWAQSDLDDESWSSQNQENTIIYLGACRNQEDTMINFKIRNRCLNHQMDNKESFVKPEGKGQNR